MAEVLVRLASERNETTLIRYRSKDGARAGFSGSDPLLGAAAQAYGGVPGPLGHQRRTVGSPPDAWPRKGRGRSRVAAPGLGRTDAGAASEHDRGGGPS